MAPKKQDLATRFWSKVDTSDECWIWVGSQRSNGYGCVYNDGRTRSAHRVAYELANGTIPEGLMVLHRCDNRICVSPSHLFLGTAHDNRHDAQQKGRLPTGKQHWSHQTPEHTTKGERHGSAKLTWEQVREMRQKYADGIPYRILAQELNITTRQAAYIVSGKKWKE